MKGGRRPAHAAPLVLVDREEVLRRLATVKDPELHRPLTELNMIDRVDISRDGVVTVGVKLTVTGCPLKERIEQDIRAALGDVPGLRDVRVELGVMSAAEREALARGVRPVRESSVTRQGSPVRVLIVASGKGGVGKSTVTVNLAAALAARGRTVGVLDADVYGFSVPRMLGVTEAPVVLAEDLILPVQVRGLRVISMGMLVSEDTPVIWRGPMLTKLIEQFLSDVEWGDDLEYLVVDAPPGTGDVAITLAQRLNRGKVVLVTTPQEAAARVAGRVAQMSRKVGQELLGVIENMAYFRCPDCGAEHAVFSAGGGEALALELEVPLLGRVPLEPGLPQAADEGEPMVWRSPESETAAVFQRIAEQVDRSRQWSEPLKEHAR
jgi:ATP-binding protein involved in chromosome partitioning